MTDSIAPDNDEVPTARMFAWARNSAAYRLSKRMMTEKQLADAIARKAREKFDGISPTQIMRLVESAIAFGRDVSALDDVAYAEIRTRSSARAGKSRRAIAQSLVQKGVDREVAHSAVAETDDLVAAVVYARRRAFGPFRKKELDDALKNRELSALVRQGFGFDICARVVSMDDEEALMVLEGRHDA